MLAAVSTKGPPKTNAIRALERAGVAYTLTTYEVAKEHVSAAEVATRVGQSLDRVFKTIVVRGDRTGPLFAVVPANAELDLKAVARASQNRRVELVRLAEVTTLTGYVRGATTVFASKKALPVVLDESALSHEMLTVSGGQRGLQVSLAPRDYVRVSKATIAAIAARG
jgi:Cys-tRNA(Pro)/Cys-tRNA(Cys) deacylase